MVQPGQTIADRFLLLRKVSAGGMGEVYQARDEQSGAQVALKIQLAQASSERFVHECELLARLIHPHIVRYIAHGALDDQTHWLAMEWLEGEDLHTRLARGPLEEAQALELAMGVSGALALAHSLNVIHRDIKPANLFLVRGSTADVRVLDFGIARHRPIEAALQHTATQTGFVVGTVGYMAPEQAAGETSLTGAVDVFALGCVLYEALTGRPAFSGDHAVAVLAKLLCDAVAAPRSIRPELSARVDQLILLMLNKRAADRPQNGTALLTELDRIQHTTDTRKSIFRLDSDPDAPTFERRFMAFLLIAPPNIASMEKTETNELSLHETALAAQIATRYGAFVTALSNRSYLVRVSGLDNAADTARTAADCGLAFASAGAHRVAVAMAPSAVGDRELTSVAVDRAAALLAMFENEPRHLIIIDDVIEGLLDARYVLDPTHRTGLQRVRATSPQSQSARVRGTILRGHERDREARSVLGQPLPFVGRERELATLEALVTEVVDESVCRIAIVTGSAGIGKSRVRAEFMKRALLARREVRQVFCVGSAVGARVVWEPIRNLLRAVTERRGQRFDEWISGHHATQQTVLAQLYGVELPGTNAELAMSLKDTPALFAESLERLVTEALQHLLATGPCVLALDDLHFSDLPSTQLLENVFRRLKDSPLMVLALGRDSSDDRLGELWRSRNPQVIHLAPLSRRSVEKLFRHVMGHAFDQLAASELISRAEGNPLFVEELIRVAVEAPENESPQSLVAIIQSRMDRLSALQRQILYVMSVFFVVTDTSMLSTVLTELSLTVLTTQLQQLCEGEWICEEAQGAYRFSHGLVRDSAYQSISDAERSALHLAVAECLNTRRGVAAIVLADHYRLGGASERAAECYAEAAEASANGSDIKAIHSAADMGLSLVVDPIVRARLMLAKLTACWLTGETSKGVVLARDAYAVLRHTQHPQKYFALARWCTCAVDIRLLDDVVSALDLLPQEPEPGLEAEWWIALGRMGFVAEIAGMREISARLFARAVAHLDELGDKNAREINSLFHFVQGMRSSFYQFEKRVKGYQRRLQHAERDPVIEQIGVLHGLGWSLMQVGAWSASIEPFERALALAEQEGYASTRAVWLVRGTASVAYCQLQQFDRAQMLASAAYEWVRTIHATRLRGAITMYYARVLHAVGQPQAALDVAREAVEAFQGPVPMQAAALATFSVFALKSGLVDEALSSSLSAITIAKAAGGLEQDELLVYLARIEALFAHGSQAEARELLEVSYQMLAARLALFEDETMRRTYMHELPENVRIMQLCEQWAVAQ
jgi:serine/threonine protein kinase/tetratricopeptide (TPR) repeat protein